MALSFTPANNPILPAGPQTSLVIQQYDFKDFTYPIDLGSEIDSTGHSLLGHWVTFFINETKGTQFNTKVPGLPPGSQPNNPIAVVVAANNSSSLSSTVSQNNQPDGTNQATNTRNTTRVPLAISLYMPPQIATAYFAAWGEAELGLWGNLAQSFSAARNNRSLDGILSAIKEAGGAATQEIIKDALAAAAPFTDISGDNLKGTISGALRMAINPHAEIIFNGIGFRGFQFDFKFTPRTEDEAIAADNIIQAFKFYSAPEISNGLAGPFWIYPAEFDIQFYSNGRPNTYLNKISTCALTSIGVNYTANGMFSSFNPGRTLNGVTVETNLTLNFVELEVMSKTRIQQGY